MSIDRGGAAQALEPLSFETNDPEPAHEWLRSAYIDHTVRLSGSRERFVFRNTFRRTPVFDISRMRHSMAVALDTEPFDAVMVEQVHRGRFAQGAGPDDVRVGPGGAVLTPPGERILARWENVDLGVLRLDLGVVEELAAEAYGIDPGTLRFDGYRPVSAAHERHWLDLVNYITNSVLPNPAVMSSPILLRESGRLLAATLLETFPNTATAEPAVVRGEVAPAALRRAMTFIDGNARDDITLTQIARSAGVQPRALQHAFRQHLDTTPMEYVRRVRLEGAHRELQAGDPLCGDTVSSIAIRWGFGHPGRFATLYRDTYGRSPSQTLRT